MVRSSHVRNQYLASITGNLLIISYSAMCAWGGTNFELLRSDETPLDSGPLTTSEAALFVSLICAGGLTGTIIAMMCVDKCGRKVPLLCVSIIHIISLALIYIAPNKYCLCTSRVLTGIASGLAYIFLPLYISEIADVNTRGTLGSLMSFYFSLGTILGYVVIDNFDFKSQILVFMVVPTVFFITFSSFFPDSPEFLSRQNRSDLFQKSQNFYKGSVSETNEKKNSEKPEKQDPISFSDFCTRKAKKAILITFVLTAVSHLCGNFVMISYAATIFKEAGSTLSPIHSSIVIMTMQLLANFVALFLADRLGRRTLNVVSMFGSSIGLISVGLYSLYRDQLHSYNWIPIVAISSTVIIQAVGMLPLYFVVMTEILPKKIKGYATSMNFILNWILAFLLLAFYPMMSEAFGMHGCMFIFAGFCVATALFTLFVIPETKGKSYDSIMKSLE